MKLLLVVQARLGSSRLPGKVLLPLAGEPALVRMLERVRAAKSPFQLAVATTDLPEDKPIVDLCVERGIEVFCGHPLDVLDRHYQAAIHYNADAVIKIPSDCPLIDPAAIDRVLQYFLAHLGEYDFVTNLLPPTWPDGNDVEVMTRSALTSAWQEAERPFEREHTTPFIWENSGRFRVSNVTWETGHNYAQSHRFVLDYVEDYQFISAVFDRLLPALGPAFSLEQILDLLGRAPELQDINRKHLGSCWQQNHLHELKTFGPPNGPLNWVSGSP